MFQDSALLDHSFLRQCWRGIMLPLAIIILLTISTISWNLFVEIRYVSDSDFALRENQLSPDGKHRLIKYEIDIGALGYGAGGTAITPPDYEDRNIAWYKIPSCYESFGWTTENELIISTASPEHTYQCTAKQRQIKTGDLLQGVKVQVVNAEEYLLEHHLERGVTDVTPSRQS